MENENLEKLNSEESLEAYEEWLKSQIDECELCHRKFPPEVSKQEHKCAKHLLFPKDRTHIMVVCPECNYRMYQCELNNINRIDLLCSEAIRKLSPIMMEFCKKRDDIVSDSIVKAVGTNKVAKRPMLDGLYKYPNWNMDDANDVDLKHLGDLYNTFIDFARISTVWNRNSVDAVTSKKIKELRQKEKEERKKSKAKG